MPLVKGFSWEGWELGKLLMIAEMGMSTAGEVDMLLMVSGQ